MSNGRKTTKFTKRTTKRKPATRRKGTKSRAKPIGAIGKVTTTYQRGYLPFGREYRAKLPYVETTFIAADSTSQLAAVGYTWRNSVYDPRVELGGHQPLQYDILQAAYTRCWVHGMSVVLTFSNPSVDGMFVGYRIRANSNPVTTAGKTLDYIKEMRDSVAVPLNNTGSQNKTFKFYVPCAKVFGLTSQQFSDLQYSETTSNVSSGYIAIEPFAISTSPSGISDTVRVTIKLTYYCQFNNPVSQGQS